MDWLRSALVDHPEIAIFLTLGLGALLGRVAVRGFSLGTITGTLVAGVAIGALVRDIQIDGVVKQVFFLLFLFALGYRLGPQFFAGLKGSGLPQALFALLLTVVGLATALGMALLLGYNPGLAAGLSAGALTQSAVIGVAQDSISGLAENADTIDTWTQLVPVGYAVTYIFGTLGAALFCSLVAPRMLGVRDLPAAAAELERELGVNESNRDVTSPNYEVVRRSYVLREGNADGRRRVADFEAELAAASGSRVFVARYRHQGEPNDATPDSQLHPGDTIVLTARRSDLLSTHLDPIADEVDDRELLDFPVEEVTVVATSSEVVGHTLGELREHPLARRVFLKSVHRAGVEVSLRDGLEFAPGDELRIQGPLPLIEQALPHIGYPERTSDATDVVTVGLAVAVGALVGVPAVTVAGVPLGLTTSVGALLIGLLIGWRRSKSPTWGLIPSGALWFFETVGLSAFIAVVGLTAGPAFVGGLRDYGAGLFLAGVVVTLVPLFVGTLAARYVFRFNPVLTLGMLTGALTTTAAVGSVREAARSSVPLLGFTIPYAVGNIVLTIGGAVVVLFTAG